MDHREEAVPVACDRARQRVVGDRLWPCPAGPVRAAPNDHICGRAAPSAWPARHRADGHCGSIGCSREALHLSLEDSGDLRPGQSVGGGDELSGPDEAGITIDDCPNEAPWADRHVGRGRTEGTDPGSAIGRDPGRGDGHSRLIRDRSGVAAQRNQSRSIGHQAGEGGVLEGGNAVAHGP